MFKYVFGDLIHALKFQSAKYMYMLDSNHTTKHFRPGVRGCLGTRPPHVRMRCPNAPEAVLAMSMRFPVATSSAAISPEATLASVEVLLSKLALSYRSKDDCSALWTALGRLVGILGMGYYCEHIT